MTKIKALRDQRAEKAREARNLLDQNTGAKFTKEIEAQVDGLYAEIDRIDAEVERLERQARIDADDQLDDVRAEQQDRERSGMTAEQRERADRYSAAFRNFILYGERSLSAEDADILRRARAEQSGQQSNGAAGGYLVPTGWGGKLLEALKAFGGMRNVATVLPTAGGNQLPWPTVDETAVEGEIVPENTAATAGDITFGTTQIGAYKFSSKIVTIPFELLQDQGPGMDIEAFVRRALATRISRITNRLFTVGTGTAQPQGIVTAAGVGKAGATGKATDVDFDDLIDLEHSVDPAYRSMPGVGWMFHDTTLRQLKKKKDADNRPIWLPGVTSREPDTILNYRYEINQHMPQMAANAKSILFGDFSQYLIRDIMNVTLFRFDDSAFITKGQIGFLAWSRHDGKLVSAGAPVKAYQNSAT
ncbi:phage major capsid protein [Edaphosphingomonas haloaromaticamans]|uniref:Phage capsid family protein n=1 Tax=Edaphosphingomonas haloaromaticamans TaxID=653954 RepID=A0A1S1HEI8_9SPHN|nr:phage major capsid protein [Sphingomonas haloaromaticamans]OHT19916.1 Phage capsid family protein [Sphingomonas haloaromaticamans]